MTTLREAAAAALEALEMSRRFVYADNRPQCDDAITALKAALAEPQEPVAGVVLNEFGRPALVQHGQEDWHCANRKSCRLYTHPAPTQRHPQDEPVALIEELRLAGLALIGLAEHDQHCDVFDLDDEGKHKECACGYAAAISVITRAGKTATAPQRQPLTEDEAWDMWEALADRGKKGEDIVHAFARAIEDAVWEKINGIGGQDDTR